MRDLGRCSSIRVILRPRAEHNDSLDRLAAHHGNREAANQATQGLRSLSTATFAHDDDNNNERPEGGKERRISGGRR